MAYSKAAKTQAGEELIERLIFMSIYQSNIRGDNYLC